VGSGQPAAETFQQEERRTRGKPFGEINCPEPSEPVTIVADGHESSDCGLRASTAPNRRLTAERPLPTAYCLLPAANCPATSTACRRMEAAGDPTCEGGQSRA